MAYYAACYFCILGLCLVLDFAEKLDLVQRSMQIPGETSADDGEENVRPVMLYMLVPLFLFPIIILICVHDVMYHVWVV